MSYFLDPRVEFLKRGKVTQPTKRLKIEQHGDIYFLRSIGEFLLNLRVTPKGKESILSS